MLQAGIIPVTPFQQNCTILFDMDTKEGVIVDPGGDVETILEVVKKNGITLKAIWLTHGHLDHAGGAKELKEALGLDIIGPHKDDLPLLERMETQAEKFGVAMKVQNVVPDRWLEDGDRVSFGVLGSASAQSVSNRSRRAPAISFERTRAPISWMWASARQSKFWLPTNDSSPSITMYFACCTPP